MLNILDPTIATEREPIGYVPRPPHFEALRIGVIDNTRRNAQAVLLKLVERLQRTHCMKLEVLVHKHQRAPLHDGQLRDLKGRTDFVIAGIGD